MSVTRNRRWIGFSVSLAAGAAAFSLVSSSTASATPSPNPGPPKDRQPHGQVAPKTTQLNINYITRASSQASVPANSFQKVTVQCPAGLTALGGGESNSSMGSVLLTDSYPDPYAQAWIAWVRNDASVPTYVTAYVICGGS